MDYLGLFCLGAFVGSFAAAAFRSFSADGDWLKVLASVLPAIFAATVLLVVDKFNNSPAFGCYPLGLLVALLWLYSDRAIARMSGGDSRAAMLGVAHLLVALLLSIVACIFVSVPAYRQLYTQSPSGALAQQAAAVQSAGNAATASGNSIAGGCSCPASGSSPPGCTCY